MIYSDEEMTVELEKIYNAACEADEFEQIMLAGQTAANNALHVMAKNGNAAVLEWYFAKVKETGRQAFLNLNHRNTMGYAPIFLACQQGHKSTLNEEDDAEFIKANRLRCVKILLDNGSLTSFRTMLLGMTPLHWAAYNGDAEIVDELLK